MTEKDRRTLIERQLIIVDFAPNKGLDSLPRLIRSPEDRRLAERFLRFVLDYDERTATPDLQLTWSRAVDHLGLEDKTAGE